VRSAQWRRVVRDVSTPENIAGTIRQGVVGQTPS
jgi:hypothetical protein